MKYNIFDIKYKKFTYKPYFYNNEIIINSIHKFIHKTYERLTNIKIITNNKLILNKNDIPFEKIIDKYFKFANYIINKVKQYQPRFDSYTYFCYLTHLKYNFILNDKHIKTLIYKSKKRISFYTYYKNYQKILYKIINKCNNLIIMNNDYLKHFLCEEEQKEKNMDNEIINILINLKHNKKN